MRKDFASNMKVKVANPGSVPLGVEWVKDTTVNPRTKAQLINGFWREKKEIIGKVAYVSKESLRTKLRKEKKIMVKLMNASAQSISIIVPKIFIIPFE